MKPPLLPSEALKRVVRLARFDGMSLLVVSGGFALISASASDKSGALIGLLIAGAGAIELHGVGLLRAGHNGMKWLISSQLCLMAMILIYAGLRIAHPDVSWIMPYVKGEAAEPILQAAQQSGMTVEQLMVEGMSTLYVMVAAITVIYQGGMAVYYTRRRAAVEIALQEMLPE
ncbi:MAG TPA: hypothetical protein VFE25_02830 [Opitutaceae bacterium]|jgi:hypothetical protein|nr:hypothetical protein [Opitutaceae bacterium]